LTDLAFGARIELLVEQIQNSAIFMITPDGRHATWNAGVEWALRYDEAAFLGQPAELIFAPEDVDRGVPAADSARTFQICGSGRWTLDVLIGRHRSLRAFSGPRTYPTEESAITGCCEFGRRIIDGPVRNWSVDDLS
jgi:hypothetical protein